MFLIPHPNPPPLGEGVYEKRRYVRSQYNFGKQITADYG
jgi:hypothetical protein